MVHARKPGMPPPRLAAVVTAAVAAALLGGCSNGDGNQPQDNSRSPGNGATVSKRYPPAATPRTIPSVRDFDPGSGPGWKPEKGSRVVTDPKGPLADEARMLAGELKIKTAAPPAKAGDVELALRPKQRGGSEAYKLVTRDGRVAITGAGEAGVFYGTRTAVQALRSGEQLPEGVINDAPDRPQRGFQLDTARKHFSADWIKARMRQLADLKLNQLGLHFSDDQGFRIESSSHPEIVSDDHLTKAEVRSILELAKQLHITVIPEIDSPGHLGAVIAAHPDLQLVSAKGNPARGAVDITKPEASKIVDDLLREYADLFPGPYMHIGADEYQALMTEDPEASYPQLAAAAREKYGSGATVQDLATGWLNDRAAVVRKAGKKAKAWNDGFFADGKVSPDKSIEVEYWTGKEIGKRQPSEYLKEGRTVVNLNDEYLYYVLGEPNEFTYPTGERIYKEWTPAVLRGSEATTVAPTGPDKVPGGRFAVWADLAGSQTPAQVAEGIRLPLAATAQKLWDPGKPPLSWPAFVKLANQLVPAES
ncbi:glycoside hydrolase family 20 protein [Streptomyces pathocidini]|uniref:beta-N-acetylhexosaminidase n=1 Tax=Streptomyces pathocidini TaxID=1650571 RepID=UPI0033CC5025